MAEFTLLSLLLLLLVHVAGFGVGFARGRSRGWREGWSGGLDVGRHLGERQFEAARTLGRLEGRDPSDWRGQLWLLHVPLKSVLNEDVQRSGLTETPTLIVDWRPGALDDEPPEAV